MVAQGCAERMFASVYKPFGVVGGVKRGHGVAYRPRKLEGKSDRRLGGVEEAPGADQDGRGELAVGARRRGVHGLLVVLQADPERRPARRRRTRRTQGRRKSRRATRTLGVLAQEVRERPELEFEHPRGGHLF